MLLYLKHKLISIPYLFLEIENEFPFLIEIILIVKEKLSYK